MVCDQYDHSKAFRDLRSHRAIPSRAYDGFRLDLDGQDVWLGISFVMLPSGAYNLKLNPSRTSTTLGHPTILLLIIIVQLARSPTIHLLRSIKTINIDPIPIENPALTFFNLPIIPIIVPRTKVVTNKTLTKISRSVQRDRRGSAKEIEEDPVGEGRRFQETQVALRVEPFG